MLTSMHLSTQALAPTPLVILSTIPQPLAGSQLWENIGPTIELAPVSLILVYLGVPRPMPRLSPSALWLQRSADGWMRLRTDGLQAEEHWCAATSSVSSWSLSAPAAYYIAGPRFPARIGSPGPPRFDGTGARGGGVLRRLFQFCARYSRWPMSAGAACVLMLTEKCSRTTAYAYACLSSSSV
ncbi:hypothetical protein C8R47DRAFT_1202346 [Mycena vitilis]|nr:hypothetical protein C8R47DRAFT_1202346 [Mycena vitilis]